MELAAGTELDRYVAVAPLGRGGMAEVWLVRHRTLGSLHALKLLRVHHYGVAQRLLQEGRAQAQLRHPNLVAVTDVVEVGGSPALVLDYVEGPTLAELLAQGPLSWAQIDVLAQGILRGVGYAHRNGLVHRDLKPANILLSVQDGVLVPRVADFGLAKALAEDRGPVSTRTGATMGTPAYMAPEQVRDASGVDARADVFSLGAVLYEMVTGTRAFEGADTLELLQAVASGRWTPVERRAPEAPARMVSAIGWALTVDVGERCPSAQALGERWREGADSQSPDGVWDDGVLARVRGLRSVPPGPARSSDSTWMEGQGTEGLTVHPDSLGPVDAGPPATTPWGGAPTEVSWARLAALVVGGTIVGIPFTIGDLGLLYGDFLMPFVVGGPAVVALVAVASVSVGLGAALTAKERSGGRPVVPWVVLPVVVAVLGSTGTWLGANRALGLMDAMPLDDRANFATRAVAEAIVAQLSGHAIGAALSLVSAILLLWLHRERVTLDPWSPRAIAMGALAFFGGLGLWIVHPLLSGRPQIGVTEPFLIFAELSLFTLCLASMATDRPDVEMGRPRFLAAVATAFGVAHTARAVDGRYLMVRAEALARGTRDVGDIAPVVSFVKDVGHISMAPSLAWMSLGVAIALIPLWGQPMRAGTLRYALAVVFVAVVTVTIPKWSADAQTAALAAEILPGAVRAAGHAHTGLEWVDGDRGPELAVDAGTLKRGDRLVSAGGRAFADSATLVGALWDCRCDGGPQGRCVFGGCLAVGAPLTLTVSRPGGSGVSEILSTEIRYRGAGRGP